MAASIYRKARPSPKTTCGPNESDFCIGCNAVMPNGFWIYSQIDIGPRGIFVCDECLDKAKKAVRVGYTREETKP